MAGTSSLSLLTLSNSGDVLGELTDEQRLRLTDVLDRYLSALESGMPLAQEEVLRQHPDLAATLVNYFQSLEDLHDMAGGFGGHAAEDDADEDLAEGTRRIGDFELIREIGRGGMGVVYEARQISLGRRVALKILPFAAVLDSKQIARFQNEAQAAAQLHHPNIVPVFAIGVERGVHFYAMQLVNGQSLEDLIDERRQERTQRKRVRRRAAGSASADEFLTLARLGQQAAEALQAAHDYGIVHRDIKPSNLLLDAAGKLWVADFGLARMQRDVSLTRSGDLVGTLRYMSPEQVSGRAGVVDERTDVYALGATLYELATLCAAYPDESSAALLKAIETTDPIAPRKLRSEIPVDLENIILRAMARERSDRYATAAALSADLQRFLAGQPTEARAITLSERVVRWSQRRARGLILTAAALLLFVVGLAVTTFLVTRAQQQSNAQLARADRYARDAREVLDRFGMQLSERLANVAGAESVRRDLLLEASNYYRRFIADSQHDPALRGELAVAYCRLASLLDEVGTKEEALAVHERAVEYLRLRATSAGAKPTDQRQLAIALNNLALAQRRCGDSSAAAQHLEEAVAIQHAVHLAPTDDVELSVELATSHNNLGLTQQASGDEGAAEASFEAAVATLNSAGSASTTAQSRTLAAACNNLANLKKETAPIEAARFYVTAIDQLEPLAEADSAQREILQELASTLHRYGILLTRLKVHTAAVQSFDRSIQLQQQLVKLVPADVNVHCTLGSTFSNLGVAQAGSGDFVRAAASLESAIEQQQLAAQLAPSSIRIPELLARHQKLLATYLRERDARATNTKTNDQLPTAEPNRESQ